MNVGDKVQDLKGQEYILEKAYAEGGQAEAFRARRVSGNTQEDLAIKIYKQPENDRQERLQKIIDSTSALNEGLPKQTLCLPMEIIQTNGFEGVVMHHTPLGTIQMADLFAAPLKSTSSYKAYEAVVKKQEIKYKTLLLNAFHLARAVDRICRNGFTHCDLSINNVFISRKDGNISIIDMDNLATKDFLSTNVQGTPGYTAPELGMRQKSTPDEETDAHSLAVLIFNLLVFRHPLVGSDLNVDYVNDSFDPFGRDALYTDHPTVPSNRFCDGGFDLNDVPQELRTLFLEAFVDGLHNGKKRPSATKWIKPLWNAIESMYFCEKCQQTTFFTYRNPSDCLFCGHPNKRFFAMFKFSHGFTKLVEPGSILYPHHFFGGKREYDFSEKLAEVKLAPKKRLIFANRSNYLVEVEFLNGSRKLIVRDSGFELSQAKRIYFPGNIYAEVKIF